MIVQNKGRIFIKQLKYKEKQELKPVCEFNDNSNVDKQRLPTQRYRHNDTYVYIAEQSCTSNDAADKNS